MSARLDDRTRERKPLEIVSKPELDDAVLQEVKDHIGFTRKLGANKKYLWFLRLAANLDLIPKTFNEITNNVRNMKIGIAVPCHESDVQLLKIFGGGLLRLKPQPSSIYININDGSEGMREIVSSMFYQLFDEGCDAVLKASVDFYLSEHILAYVRDDVVVSFTPLALKLFDLTFALHRVFMPSRTWSGCYSIPKQVWSQIQDQFDGNDTSIMKAAGEWKVKSFQYRLLRAYREDDEYQKMRMKKLLRSFPLWKRLLWQLIRFKPVKL